MNDWKIIVWSRYDFATKEMFPRDKRIESAYFEKNFFITCLRELLYKIGICNTKFWYNNKLKNYNGTYIVKDAMISLEYLKLLKKYNPDARIILWYWNKVDLAKVKPEEVKKLGIEVWSFSISDCEQYDMKLNHTFYTNEVYERYALSAKKRENREKYDLVFVGKDKGRMKTIHDMQKLESLKNIRWYTYFVGNHFYEFYKNSEYHKRNLSYENTLLLEKDSKGILEIVPTGSTGLTVRTMDSLVLQKKLVTNNKAIMQVEFYDPNNIFVLGERNLNELAKFLNTPYIKVENEIKEKFEFSNWINRFFE